MSFEISAQEPGAKNAKTFEAGKVRRDFPLLDFRQTEPMVYLDAAATTPKPRSVLKAMNDFYQNDYANVHRGVYPLAERATAAFEAARDKVAHFVGMPERTGVIFTKNCTEAINLVAHSWAKKQLKAGDELLVTALEHHSNFLPWLQLAKEKGIHLKSLPLAADESLDLASLDRWINKRTRLVALTGLSNVLGTVTPLAPVIDAAKAVGARVLIDGAQWVMHQPVDFWATKADFLTFSGHKLLGPTGVGVLVGLPELLEEMPPFLSGGEMVLDVSLDGAIWNDLPYKFEAGTPMIAEAIGLGAAMDYLSSFSWDDIQMHDRRLWQRGMSILREIEGVKIYGPQRSEHSVATFCFNLFDRQGNLIHPHDVGTLLSREGVAIRVGHHCAKPLMGALGVSATCRASAYIYNTEEDLVALGVALRRARDFFSRQ